MTVVQVVRLEPSDKWTHGLLDRIFDRSLWPHGDLEWEVVDPVEADSRPAVVVVPGEEWAGRLEILNRLLNRFERVVVAIIADEGSTFPWQALEHPRMRLWIQTPRPGIHPPGAAHYFGFGWRYDTPDLVEQAGREDPMREWFFAGQVTHERRRELVAVLRRMSDGLLLETKSFGAGYNRAKYVEEILRSRWVPCPSGPVCPDSFRLYEVLEAGRVPFVDAECPGYPPEISGRDYWRLVYGDDASLLAPIGEWSQLEQIERDAPWPAIGVWQGLKGPYLSSWWQTVKRDTAWRMRDDALDVEPGTPVDGITVVVSSSPIPSHPSLDILEGTLESIRDRLPDADVIVVADGWRDDAPVTRSAYLEYLERLVWCCNHPDAGAHRARWEWTLPLVEPRWQHQANGLRHALAKVRTSTVLVLEHDTPLCGPVDLPWDGMVEAIHSGAANLVRFSSEETVLEPWRHLYLEPDSPEVVCGVPMLRTVQWSSRPHLAGAAWYRRILDAYFAPDSRTYTEDVLHGVVQAAHKARGEEGWREWRLWTYAPDLEALKRSTHTDGRAGYDKGEDRMIFAYPGGGTPPGAPRATRDRVPE